MCCNRSCSSRQQLTRYLSSNKSGEAYCVLPPTPHHAASWCCRPLWQHADQLIAATIGRSVHIVMAASAKSQVRSQLKMLLHCDSALLQSLHRESMQCLLLYYLYYQVYTHALVYMLLAANVCVVALLFCQLSIVASWQLCKQIVMELNLRLCMQIQRFEIKTSLS